MLNFQSLFLTDDLYDLYPLGYCLAYEMDEKTKFVKHVRSFDCNHFINQLAFGKHSPEKVLEISMKIEIFQDTINDYILHTFAHKEAIKDIPCLLNDLKEMVLSYTKPKTSDIGRVLKYCFPKMQYSNLKLSNTMNFLNENQKCVPILIHENGDDHRDRKDHRLDFLFFITDQPPEKHKIERKVFEIKIDEKCNDNSESGKLSLLFDKTLKFFDNRNLWEPGAGTGAGAPKPKVIIYLPKSNSTKNKKSVGCQDKWEIENQRIRFNKLISRMNRIGLGVQVIK